MHIGTQSYCFVKLTSFLFGLVPLLTNVGAVAQSTTSPFTPSASINQPAFQVVNRTINALTERGKTGIRFSAAEGVGIAWLADTEFSEGSIEFDIRGKDVVQRSFVGVAFHGQDDQTYESVYFRPFNFRSTDPVRKTHAVQYVYAPKFEFQTLRDTRKDEFENAVVPAPEPTAWFHAKVDVRAGRVRIFVNNAPTPSLDVATLNSTPAGKRIGFWVGNNSDGEVANLKLTK